MPDDPSKRGGQDRQRINVGQEHELRDWAKKFDASPEQIKEAVRAVGDHADKVEQHLKGSRATQNSDRVREVLKSGAGERKPPKRAEH